MAFLNSLLIGNIIKLTCFPVMFMYIELKALKIVDCQEIICLWFPFVFCRLRVFMSLSPNTSRRRKIATNATSIGSLCLKFHRELIIELVTKVQSFSHDRFIIHAKWVHSSNLQGFGSLTNWNDLWDSCHIFLASQLPLML